MTAPRQGRGKSKESIAIITAAIAILSEIQPAHHDAYPRIKNSLQALQGALALEWAA